jgi:hypothetical protein
MAAIWQEAVRPAGDWRITEDSQGDPLRCVYIEHANVIQGYILCAGKNLVVSATIDHQVIVLIPILEDCSSMEYPGARRPPRKVRYSPHLQ